MKTIKYSLVFLCLSCIFFQASAQLMTSASADPNALANAIVGAGISISNAAITCPGGASGTFSNGGFTNIGLDDGVLLASGAISNAIGPNNSTSAATAYFAAGDADLSAISGFTTFDACVLEFDFEAVANLVSISFVFGSEEYEEWVNTGFNDVFGFLVSGPNPGGGNYLNENIATIPVSIPVTINSINHLVNTAFYVNNDNGPTIQYDGFTVKLTSTLAIVPCATYEFKLAIADASDASWDSGVFLEEASFEASITCQDFDLLLGPDGTGTVTAEDLLASNLGLCDFSYSLSQSEFTCADEGENLVTVTAEDEDGNVLTCEATVTVTVPPNILSIDIGDFCREVYMGYGPASCTTLTADVSGGNGPYTYDWSDGGTTQSITVCPTTNTGYNVTVTDANGCVEVSYSIYVLVVDVRCGNNGNKVLVCHIPPGNPGNAHTICISPNAVPAHLAHGCFLGDCSETEDPCSLFGEGYAENPVLFKPTMEVTEPTLWPNPGTDEINLEIPDIFVGDVLVDLLTPDGTQLRSYSMKEGQHALTLPDLSYLSNGMYNLRIRDEAGQQYMLKWLKSN